MKNFLYLLFVFFIIPINNIFAWKPKILDGVESELPWNWVNSDNIAKELGWDLIATMIKYVAIISVISLMLSWIMYLISNWEEEKVKKAKNWIIWSLVWVLLSISAWGIIEMINKIQINN